MSQPLVLVVLDGWGLSSAVQGNAIREATIPTFDTLNKSYPLTILQASGMSVGLPWGTPGNSEVGHMTMGAGRIIYQNLPRITLSIDDNSFFKNEALLAAAENVRSHNSAFHIMGLLSTGSVHSHKDHLYALVHFAKEQKLQKVFRHIFTDGRDSSPTAGIQEIEKLQNFLKEAGLGKIVSVSGRHYAMDRNHNWDRIQEAYTCLTKGSPSTHTDPEELLATSYQEGFTDEFVVPTNIVEADGTRHLIEANDSVVFFNFREDRARELTEVFTSPEFKNFERPLLPLTFVTMVEYEKDQKALVAFPPTTARNTLGEVLSQNGKLQIRIAETEKYAHVTYFFNGGTEKPFPGEDRKLVPSQIVTHFDEAPEMSAPQITDAVLEALEKDQYDFILVNYANADMVGHTGNEAATIKAVEATDKSLEKLIPAVLEKNGRLLITADHGNAEEMVHSISNETDTEHSANPVPCWFVTANNHREKNGEQMMREQSQVNGLLSDIAPTILALMDLPKPPEMNGSSLLSILCQK